MDSECDMCLSAGGWTLAINVRGSSSPAAVAAFADALNDPTLAVDVLVVPFMTAGAVRAASERQVNWIDLSGNASVRAHGLHVRVQGFPNQFRARGRPASAFGAKSGRVTRTLLLDPERFWTQKQLAEATGLSPAAVSRTVRRLNDMVLLERDGASFRPRDRDLLLDTWAADYRLDRHDIVMGHVTGSGVELAHELHRRLAEADVEHAFTGLAAAWVWDMFARFRLVSVYVDGDPRTAAERIGLRREARGANVQLIGPDDGGVLDGRRTISDLPCVALPQIYIDLTHLPERAAEAAQELRDQGLWRDDPTNGMRAG